MLIAGDGCAGLSVQVGDLQGYTEAELRGLGIRGAHAKRMLTGPGK